MSSPIPKNVQRVGSFSETLKKEIADYNQLDLQFIEKAFNFAREKHHEQFRISGEPYFSHPLKVARYIVKHRPDADTIVAAILHDVVEDCCVSLPELTTLFNADVARLVDGVTKISSINIKDKALELEFSKNNFTSQIDSYRKLLTAMAGDPRVLIIKLYDRLHNATTLEWLPENRRPFYAKETIEIYAALAERIGMSEIKAELEDLAFPYAFPQEYENFIKNITAAKTDRTAYINKVIKILSKKIKALEIYGRAKHDYSVYNKLKEKKYLSEIFDLVAIRIIAHTTADCYKILGQVHSIYEPVESEITDYIARPRAGIYKSLHTVVKATDDVIFEVQIRTREMHETAEFGIAAHWFYKEQKFSKISKKSAESWMPELENGNFIDSNKKFFANKIFVFSPQGKIVELPKNSTPLDFAFHIHTELGLSCYGAKINSKIVPISSALKTGDVVEIIKNDRAKPSRDWLAFVKSNFARSKIREYFADMERPKNYSAGLALVNDELKKLNKDGITDKNQKLLSTKIGNSRLPFNDLYTALVSVGKHDISKNEIIRVFYPEISFSEDKTVRKSADKKSVRFEIGEGFTHRFANCCKPKHGDDVLGYITLQKNISVHNKKCREVRRFDSERIIEANWAD